MKYIDIKEFRKEGYLQEVNRRFRHPLGLALAIQINDDGSEEIGVIWDAREDDVGIIFDFDNAPQNILDQAQERRFNINRKWKERAIQRENKLGENIETVRLTERLNGNIK